MIQKIAWFQKDNNDVLIITNNNDSFDLSMRRILLRSQ